MMIPQPKSYSKISLRVLLFLFTVWLGIGNAQAQCPFTPGFTHPSSYICAGSSLTFTNTTSGTVTGYSWFENVTLFSNAASPTRTFNIPGPYIISLVETNGSCLDTVQSAILVSPQMTASLVPTNPTCFNGTNGSVNLTPGGGTPNRSINNDRNISDYTAANTVSNAGYASGITVEAWVKPRSTWTTGDGLFIAFNQTTGTGNRFFVGYNPGFQQFVYFDDNLGNAFYTGTQPRGNWYHIAVTISSSNVVSLYLNGTLNRTVNSNAGWIPQVGDRFSIGQEWDYTVLSQHFDGWIDEARVWNTVLSPATILSNRNSCMGINNSHPNWNNIVAYYSMNEGSGTYIFDRSGKNNHGTRVNGSVYGTAAETNWGCFSDGSGYGYSWSTGATTQDIAGLAAGTYTVTLMDGAGAGCNPVQSTVLTNPAQVVVSITPPGPVQLCAGASTSLTASGANTYSWSPATGLSATTGTTVTATPPSTQTYTCIGTNGVGCTGSQTVQVVVNPLPTATISGTNVICNGTSTTLTGGGGVSYMWSNGPTTAANTVAPATTTTYTVTATNSFNCTDTEVITVTVNPLPTVSFSGDTTICAGDTTTVTAGGGTSYVWNNGPTTAGNTVFPGTTTGYTVTVTDANTCQNSGTVSVTVNPLPVVSITGVDTICVGDSTTITASGGTSYIWNNGPATAAQTVGPLINTTYSVTATDANTCENSGSIDIVVNSLPVLLFSGNDTICDGDTTQITVSGANTYVWGHGPTTATVSLSASVSTFYDVLGTDGNGCQAMDSIELIVNTLPSLTITGNDSICMGDSTQLLGSGASTYSWSTGDLTAMISVAPATNTNYVLTGTDGNGCSNDVSLLVVVNALPTPTITGTDTICAGDTTTLTASGGASYFWSTFQNTASISVAPSTNTSYTVTATDANGCEGTATASVVVNALPATPTITQSGTLLTATAGFTTYQWYFNGSAIPGATNSTYTASLDGDYTVTVTNAAGCSATSAPLPVIIIGVNPGFLTSFGLEVYPNPNAGQFTVRLDLERDRNVTLRIFDLYGKQVWNKTGDLPFGEWKQNIDFSHLTKGTYMLDVTSEGQRVTKKIVVQ